MFITNSKDSRFSIIASSHLSPPSYDTTCQSVAVRRGGRGWLIGFSPPEGFLKFNGELELAIRCRFIAHVHTLSCYMLNASSSNGHSFFKSSRPIEVDSDDSLSEGELVREMNWRESMLKYLISKNFEMCMSKVPTPSSMMSYPKLLQLDPALLSMQW